jgi:hypothetical protein
LRLIVATEARLVSRASHVRFKAGVGSAFPLADQTDEIVVAGVWIVEGPAGGEQLFELETKTLLLRLKKFFCAIVSCSSRRLKHSRARLIYGVALNRVVVARRATAGIEVNTSLCAVVERIVEHLIAISTHQFHRRSKPLA